MTTTTTNLDFSLTGLLFQYYPLFTTGPQGGIIGFFAAQWLRLRRGVAIHVPRRLDLRRWGLDILHNRMLRWQSWRFLLILNTRIRQYYVENLVELCVRSSRSIEGMKKRTRKKSLNRRLVHGVGSGSG